MRCCFLPLMETTQPQWKPWCRIESSSHCIGFVLCLAYFSYFFKATPHLPLQWKVQLAAPVAFKQHRDKYKIWIAIFWDIVQVFLSQMGNLVIFRDHLALTFSKEQCCITYPRIIASAWPMTSFRIFLAMCLSSFFLQQLSMKGGTWCLVGARSFHLQSFIQKLAGCPANRNLSCDSGRGGREQGMWEVERIGGRNPEKAKKKGKDRVSGLVGVKSWKELIVNMVDLILEEANKKGEEKGSVVVWEGSVSCRVLRWFSLSKLENWSKCLQCWLGFLLRICDLTGLLNGFIDWISRG